MQEWFEHEDSEEELGQILGNIESPVARLLEKALGPEDLSENDGLVLAQVKGEELHALLLAADVLRKRAVGDTITYVITRNINFTNVCIIGCKFCAFMTGPKSPDAWNHSLQDIGNKTREAWERGGTEVCVQGGLPRDLKPYYYRDILRAIREAVPQIHIHAFSPMEIIYGIEKTGMDLRDYLKMLREAGLDSIPGTAAEILDPQIRQVLSKNKVTVEQWMKVIRTAHELGIPTTSTIMYGHIEKPEHWVRHILLLRSIQQETGGFTEFVPLGFIHHNTDLYRSGLARPGATLEEHLKIHALSRILLKGWIDHVQVAWVKMGRTVSQWCLRGGADDFGGTLMEESISRLAGSEEGQNMDPEEFQDLIWQIGRTPAQRSTTYEILKRFPAPSASRSASVDVQ
ncbi:MAG: 5-amino-6-(D-ribitylamino)uracil--L-tyrosine 4-hydroxyphenyl transferase CofH [Candidatus Tectomicrobia bacterium]|uniref:FO synthase n=1 Tax=Tectimicrobiota bacterium TaxID=2528274 RepID=A0A932M0S8_UNCTE|nr:5-amino-6-(D-ribitylamino)uracil--L-tyrosine 4-hydroxyphenyl transferase CofH [Candidatus Tectomicrobia bacterium]